MQILQMKMETFQFHKGTIKTPEPDSALEKEMNFNSIKVRLKPVVLIGGGGASWISIP